MLTKTKSRKHKPKIQLHVECVSVDLHTDLTDVLLPVSLRCRENTPTGDVNTDEHPHRNLIRVTQNFFLKIWDMNAGSRPPIYHLASQEYVSAVNHLFLLHLTAKQKPKCDVKELK